MRSESLDELSNDFISLDKITSESKTKSNSNADLGIIVAEPQKKFYKKNFIYVSDASKNSIWRNELLELKMNIEPNSSNNDSSIEIFNIFRNESLLTNQIPNDISKDIYFLHNKTLHNKIQRNESESKKNVKTNNIKGIIGTNFFNGFLINKIKEMKDDCGCILDFKKFPKKFIRNAVNHKNKEILDFTFEELIKLAKSCNDSQLNDEDYLRNLEVLEELQSDENREIMEKLGYDKILKMKYRDLFEDYLNSKEYNEKIKSLESKKDILKSFKEISKVFLNTFNN